MMLQKTKVLIVNLLIVTLVFRTSSTERLSKSSVSVPSNTSFQVPSQSIKAHFTCAWLSQLYVDNIPLPEGPHKRSTYKADSFFIPPGQRVIAIYCISRYGPRGFLGSFEDGQVTDASWKCTNQHFGGWYQDIYDDSHWSHAREMTTNAQSPTPVISVRKSASWIGTDNLSSWQLYCRKKINLQKTGNRPIPMFFTVLKNKDHALMNQTIKISNVTSVFECFKECAHMFEWCVSFNYQYNTSVATQIGTALCELNHAVRDKISKKLVSRTGFIYYEIQTP